MKWYDSKTPDRLSILAVQMMVFIFWFNISQDPIEYKLAMTGFFMIFITILIFPEVDVFSKEGLIIHAALPVGLLISSVLMTVDYQDIQMAFQITGNFLKKHSPELLWLLAVFLAMHIVDQKTESNSR